MCGWPRWDVQRRNRQDSNSLKPPGWGCWEVPLLVSLITSIVLADISWKLLLYPPLSSLWCSHSPLHISPHFPPNQQLLVVISNSCNSGSLSHFNCFCQLISKALLGVWKGWGKYALYIQMQLFWDSNTACITALTMEHFCCIFMQIHEI